MAISKQAGYTLIELMLVIAISGSLLTIALVGQRNLRSQASFDASINKIVATIADAHNESTAAINTAGSGDGSVPCSGVANPANRYVFAGVAWNVADAPITGPTSGAKVTMDFYEASRPGVACSFQTRNISIPSLVQMSWDTSAPSGKTMRMLFVRDAAGGLNVCATPSADPTSVYASFVAGSCVAPAGAAAVTDLYFSDADGHASRIQIDSSGLAKRIN